MDSWCLIVVAGEPLQVRWFLLRQLQDPWLRVAINMKFDMKTPPQLHGHQNEVQPGDTPKSLDTNSQALEIEDNQYEFGDGYVTPPQSPKNLRDDEDQPLNKLEPDDIKQIPKPDKSELDDIKQPQKSDKKPDDIKQPPNKSEPNQAGLG